MTTLKMASNSLKFKGINSRSKMIINKGPETQFLVVFYGYPSLIWNTTLFKSKRATWLTFISYNGN